MRILSLKISVVLALALSGMAVVPAARAADAAYPAGPVTLLVPNPPGGASDNVARILAVPLTALLQKPVIIFNRPGLGGAIGAGQAAAAKPDGLTVLVALSNIVVSPEAERISGRKPLYEVNQLKAVALLASDPMVLVVRADSPWNSLADLIEAAKAKPGGLSYASSGNFGSIHLSVESLAHAAGIKLLQVPFGGGAPSLLALLGGQVAFTTGVPSVVAPQIAAGKVRPLAVSGTTRLAAFPDVPTYIQAGFDAQFDTWCGLYVPAATPDVVIQQLRRHVQTAVQGADFTKAMREQGQQIRYMDAPEFDRFSAAEGQRMIKVVRAIGKID